MGTGSWLSIRRDDQGRFRGLFDQSVLHPPVVSLQQYTVMAIRLHADWAVFCIEAQDTRIGLQSDGQTTPCREAVLKYALTVDLDNRMIRKRLNVGGAMVLSRTVAYTLVIVSWALAAYGDTL